VRIVSASTPRLERSQSIARTWRGGRRLAVAARASANSGRRDRPSAVVPDGGASMATHTITPDEALELTAPTDGFLCPLSANVYGIDFLEFEIKDYDSGESIFHVRSTLPGRGTCRRQLAFIQTAGGAVSPCLSSSAFSLLLRASPRL
jgi:hypothetical protein